MIPKDLEKLSPTEAKTQLEVLPVIDIFRLLAHVDPHVIERFAADKTFLMWSGKLLKENTEIKEQVYKEIEKELNEENKG